MYRAGTISILKITKGQEYNKNEDGVTTLLTSLIAVVWESCLFGLLRVFFFFFFVSFFFFFFLFLFDFFFFCDLLSICVFYLFRV